MEIDEANKFIGTCVLIDPRNHGKDACWHRGMLMGVHNNDGIVKPKNHKHCIHVDLKYLKPWKKGISMNDPKKADELFGGADKPNNATEVGKNYILRYLSTVSGHYFYYSKPKFIEIPNHEFKAAHKNNEITVYNDVKNACRAGYKILSSKKRGITDLEIFCIDNNSIFNTVYRKISSLEVKTASESQAPKPTTIVEPIQSNPGLIKDLNKLFENYKEQKQITLMAHEIAKDEEMKLLKIESDIDILMMENKLTKHLESITQKA